MADPIRYGDYGVQEFSELMELVERLENPLEKLNVFSTEYIEGTLATLERRLAGSDDLYAVERGADRQVAGDDTAEYAYIQAPLFTVDKALKPAELIDCRQFGTDAERKTARKAIEGIVSRIKRDQFKVFRKSMYSALIDNKSYGPNKDGSDNPKYVKNFQSMWGVADADMYNATADGAATFDLTSTASPSAEFEKFRKHVIDNAGDAGDNYEIVMLMDSLSFSALIANDEYVDAAANTADRKLLMERLGGLSNARVLEFEGVVFIEDTTRLLADNSGIMFPLGIEDMFQVKIAPADTFEALEMTGEAGADNYLIVESTPRKITASADLSIVCSINRPELVARYDFS